MKKHTNFTLSNEEKVDILRHLINIKSVNGNEKEVAEYIKSLLSKHGIDSNIVLFSKSDSQRANLVAEIGEGDNILALTGHMDTVGVNEEEWNTNPFELTVKDDKMFGRGTSDMKAGLAAMIIAMIEIKENKKQLNGKIRLLATGGEEVGMPGSEYLEENGYMEGVSTLIVGEPSGYQIGFANKGEINITFTANGKSAHSSMPENGINAIHNFIDFWMNLKNKLDKHNSTINNPVLGKNVYNIDVINGGSQENTIPSKVTALLNIRTVPEFNNEDTIKIIDDSIKEFNSEQPENGQITYQLGMQVIPIQGKSDSKLMEITKNITEDIVGVNMPIVGVPGGTDASKLLAHHPKGFNTIIFGPGNGDTVHQSNEYCDVDIFLNFTKIYTKLFVDYLKCSV